MRLFVVENLNTLKSCSLNNDYSLRCSLLYYSKNKFGYVQACMTVSVRQYGKANQLDYHPALSKK